MTRWFTTLLYALMFACTALPVHAAAAAVATVGEISVATGVQADEAQATGAQLPLSAETPEDSSSGGGANDGNTPEVPEFYFEALPHLALPVQMNETPAGIVAALAPPPFLKGPQRPPRAAASAQDA